MEVEGLTLGIIIGAALADSINPCVFGVLIFLIAFMQKVFKTRNRMLVGGLFYTAVVYATYLAIGFGLLKVLQDALPTAVSAGVDWVAAIIDIIAGLLEIKDFFAYGKGFTLQMIPGAADRIKLYTSKIEKLYANHPRWSFVFVGLLGVFVVLVELPCTGAPYFAVINLLQQGAYATAVPMLLLYNFIFIIPLFFIIGLSYFGNTEKIKAWRDRNKGAMRLGIGIVLIALGIYMIMSLI
jgi:cytochrome c biogenesis protein CcdA